MGNCSQTSEFMYLLVYNFHLYTDIAISAMLFIYYEYVVLYQDWSWLIVVFILFVGNYKEVHDIYIYIYDIYIYMLYISYYSKALVIVIKNEMDEIVLIYLIHNNPFVKYLRNNIRWGSKRLGILIKGVIDIYVVPRSPWFDIVFKT